MIKRYWGSAMRRINSIAVNKKRKTLNSKYPELQKIFFDYISSFHKDGGFEYSIQDIKVLQLLDLLIEKKAKNIVEYGTGSTSLACAYYAVNYGAYYLGLDESEKWAKLNNERLHEFIPNATGNYIVHSPRVDNHSEDIYFTHLEYTPDRHFDFMLIDGPSFVLDTTHKCKVNNDIVKYLDKSLPETIIVDNRVSTVGWLKTFLKDNYRSKDSANWQIKKKILKADTFNYYSVFEKLRPKGTS